MDSVAVAIVISALMMIIAFLATRDDDSADLTRATTPTVVINEEKPRWSHYRRHWSEGRRHWSDGRHYVRASGSPPHVVPLSTPAIYVPPASVGRGNTVNRPGGRGRWS